MISINLDKQAASAYLSDAIELASCNAPQLTALGGPTHAVEKLAEELKGKGISHRILHTSHAFHTSAMAEARDSFTAVVSRQQLKEPQLHPSAGSSDGRAAQTAAAGCHCSICAARLCRLP